MEDSTLFSIDEATFREFIKHRSLENRSKFGDFLKSVPILSRLLLYDKECLCDAITLERFSEGEVIIQEGDQNPQKMYIIYKGEALAFKLIEGEQVQVYQFGETDYFGELSLMRNSSRSASVVAKTDLELLAIDKLTFRRLCAEIGYEFKDGESRYKYD